MNENLPESSIDLLKPVTELVLDMEQSKWKMPAILGLGLAAAGLSLTYFSLQKESERIEGGAVVAIEV